MLRKNSVKSREIKTHAMIKKSHLLLSGALNVTVQDPYIHCFYNNITLKQKANEKGKNA